MRLLFQSQCCIFNDVFATSRWTDSFAAVFATDCVAICPCQGMYGVIYLVPAVQSETTVLC